MNWIRICIRLMFKRLCLRDYVEEKRWKRRGRREEVEEKRCLTCH
jgi:hypothetical protein